MVHLVDEIDLDLGFTLHGKRSTRLSQLTL